jgi:hypothetical protein
MEDVCGLLVGVPFTVASLTKRVTRTRSRGTTVRNVMSRLAPALVVGGQVAQHPLSADASVDGQKDVHVAPFVACHKLAAARGACPCDSEQTA